MRLKNKLFTILIVVFTVFLTVSPKAISKQEALTSDFESMVSDYVYLYDTTNDVEVYSKQGKEQFYPASLTKMMTLIVGIENIQDTSAQITIDATIMDGLIEAQASRAGFGLGDEVSIMDLFYGIMLPSGAECTRAIAQYVAGSESAYVELMNQKALELGMENTHFVNTTGLHDENHYSTPYDMALLLDYCSQNELFMQLFTTDMYTSAPTATYPSGLPMESTTHRYCTKIYGDSCPSLMIGSKTGFTNPALYCLASIADINGIRYILITGHAPWEDNANNVTDAVNTYLTLENQEYTYQQFYDVGDVIVDQKVERTWNDHLIIKADESIGYTLPKGSTSHVYIDNEYSAPLIEGTTIGLLTIEKDGNIFVEIPLVVEQTIEPSGLIVLMEKFIEWFSYYWWTIPLGCILIIALSLVLIIIRNKRIKARRRKLRAKRRAQQRKVGKYEN